MRGTAARKGLMIYARPWMADLRPKWADLRPDMADLRPERADLRPQRADFVLVRAVLRGWIWGLKGVIGLIGLI